MKTQYYTATSLDGYIADEQHSLDWLFQFSGGAGDGYATFMADVGAVAMGSTTYDWVLDNDLLKDPAKPKPWPYKEPTWVFTTRELRRVPKSDHIRFVRGDVRPVHAEMAAAAKGKNVWLVGGGELVGQFHDAGLLDELIVTVAAVTLGRGAPLLPRRIVTPPLRLTGTNVVGGTFVELRYAVQR